jgi:hypothetical protein
VCSSYRRHELEQCRMWECQCFILPWAPQSQSQSLRLSESSPNCTAGLCTALIAVFITVCSRELSDVRLHAMMHFTGGSGELGAYQACMGDSATRVQVHVVLRLP